MFKQSSSRHQRSKVLKLKHALQICVLVAVCVWLLYQVNHSHDRKELEMISTSINAESNPMIFGLGRKVLPDAHVVTNAGNGNIEDKEIEDVEEGKHEEKKEGGEEESRGSEDDDTDENDKEKGEEGRQDEEVGDEEENEVKMDEKSLLGSTDSDEEDEKSTQEAREEQYKGDDASSAVVRESIEENHDVGDGDEEHKHDVEVNGDEISDEPDSHKADRSGFVAQEVDDSSSTQKEEDAHVYNNSSFNETHPAEDPNLTDGSLLNSTIPELSEKIVQPFNASLETASNHTVNGDENFALENSTFAIVPNDTVHFSQNISTTALEMVSDNLPSENETASVIIEGGQNSTATTETLVDDKFSESGAGGSATPVNHETEPKEKTDNAIDITGGSEEASHDSSSTGDAHESAHDESGESVKADAITEEEKDARTDLSTLAEMQLEGTRSIEEIAAE